MVVVVVFPIGAAIAGGMCVLKTKCAWLFTASEATTRKVRFKYGTG